jgi:hypothetical protein
VRPYNWAAATWITFNVHRAARGRHDKKKVQQESSGPPRVRPTGRIPPKTERLEKIDPSGETRAGLSDGFEIFNQILLFFFAQLQIKVLVIMVNYLFQLGKSAVMIEAALVNLLAVPQSS